MGLRIQALLVSVFTAFAAVYASALGLGEIKLNSALNQPLDAEIRLLQVRDLTEKEIIIGLASQDEFQRLGIERPHYLTDLSFAVDLGASGGPVVKVSTLKPIREPFLDFIVQAQWPSGKLLREYTLLIDLPVFSGDQPAQAAAPPPARPAPEPARPTAPVRDTVEQRPAPVDTGRPGTTDRARDAAPQADFANEYGPVAPNENLWSIATRSRPDNTVTVQQTMLAIQRLNPQAFINENINLLRRGEVLRLPSKDDIVSLDNREAIQRVAEQNQIWSERAEAARAQLQGTRTEQPRPEVPVQPEGRVKLTTPTESTSEAAQGSGGSDAAASLEAKENELAIAQEQFDAARRERSEIRSRRAALDAQAETLERLLEVSSEELRMLELAAGQMNEAGRAAEETVAPTPDVAEAPVAPDTAAQTQEDVAELPRTVPPSRPSRSFVDLLMDNLLYIGGALGLLLVGVAVFLYMRGRDDGFDSDDFDSLPDNFAGMNFDDAEDVDVQEDDKTVVLGADGNGEDDRTEVMEPEAFSREAETEDVVAECDIHIAYGQYDQAEEKLTAALEREPRNTAVHLKLLEVYAAQQDGERFDDAYARLRLLDSREALDRAQSLRTTIQGIEPFDDKKHDPAGFSAVLAGSGAALAGAEAARSLSDDDSMADASADDDALDFDLDLDGSLDDLDAALGQDEEEPEDKTVLAFRDQDTATEETLDLDFDLDDLDGLGDLDQSDLEDADAFLQSSEIEDSGSDGVDFDLDEDFEGSLDSGEDGGTLAEKVSAETGEEGLVLDEDSLADYGADTPLSPGIEETDFLNMDGDELDLVGGERDGLDDDLADDFNLDDLDHDLDELAGSFDGDFEDLEATTNEGGMEPLATVAEEFSGDFSDLEEPDSDDESGIDGMDETDEQVVIDEAVKADERTLPDAIELSDDGLDGYAETDDATPVAGGASEFELPDFDPEEDDDTNLGFLSDSDETATKLDLARAYIDMGDADGAKDILDEILEEGDNDQRKEAENLMAKLG